MNKLIKIPLYILISIIITYILHEGGHLIAILIITGEFPLVGIVDGLFTLGVYQEITMTEFTIISLSAYLTLIIGLILIIILPKKKTIFTNILSLTIMIEIIGNIWVNPNDFIMLNSNILLIFRGIGLILICFLIKKFAIEFEELFINCHLNKQKIVEVK